MQILWGSILALCRKVGSAPPRCWWPPALAQRHTQFVASASVYPNQHVNNFSRPWSMQRHLLCSTTKCTDTSEMRPKVTKEAIDNFTPTLVGHRYNNGIWYPYLHRDSTHRDGAIYENMYIEEEYFYCDITDRNETHLEPMMFSEALETCSYSGDYCMHHLPSDMFQVFSVTLAQNLTSNCSMQLYGYIAVRDMQDGMLNYIINRNRDDPITVQQGSFIEMMGPKRGIYMGNNNILIEFDMWIINGEHEDCDLQLIDGAMSCRYRRPWKPIINRIVSDYGAVDISLAYVEHGVEATIEVAISEVRRDFSLSLSSLTYLMENYEEILLFCGTISQDVALRRYVVAVTFGTEMQLKFKLDNNNFVWSGTFETMAHGSASQEIKLDLGSILVKVTWSSI